MKRIIWGIGLLLVIGVLVSSNGNIAKAKPVVYGDKQIIAAGEEREIAIRIKGNPGIMGFKIHGTYETSQLEVLSIRQGNRTEKGTFVHNAGETKGAFDVLWCNVEDMEEDGTLFYIKVKAGKNQAGETAIALDYSKEDTFNEEWEDVVLGMENVILCFEKEKSESQKETQTQSQTQSQTKKKPQSEKSGQSQISQNTSEKTSQVSPAEKIDSREDLDAEREKRRETDEDEVPKKTPRMQPSGEEEIPDASGIAAGETSSIATGTEPPVPAENKYSTDRKGIIIFGALAIIAGFAAVIGWKKYHSKKDK